MEVRENAIADAAQCARDQQAAGVDLGAPLSELAWPMAAAWPVELVNEDLRQLQESEVEMLLVNGAIDFSTPPNALNEAEPYYHNAQYVLLPEFSHVGDVEKLQPEAFEQLITSYYDTGVADASLFVYEPLSFEPGMSLPVMAKLLVAAVVLLPALLILGVYMGVRFVRQPLLHDEPRGVFSANNPAWRAVRTPPLTSTIFSRFKSI